MRSAELPAAHHHPVHGASMTEALAGSIGGLGLFMVGMWILTDNLKALATRR